MLAIVTGLPGHGKTLNTLAEIDAKFAGQRAIFYNNIPEVTLDGWTKFDDVSLWHELPQGAVIVIDEAQQFFPPRGASRTKPPEVAAFETHRHNGHDIYLITQSAKLLDAALRELCACHIHYIRAFGTNAATRWEWQRVVNPQSKADQAQVVSKKLVRHPKKYYSMYKSSAEHTVTRELPFKVFLMPIALLGVCVAGYLAWRTVHSIGVDETKQVAETAESASTPVSSASSLPAPRPAPRPPETFGSPAPSYVVGMWDFGTRRTAILERNGTTFRVDAMQYCRSDEFGQMTCVYKGVTYTDGFRPQQDAISGVRAKNGGGVLPDWVPDAPKTADQNA